MTHQHLETSIKQLDKHLGGGFPPGAIVTVTTDPRTHGELLLYQLIAGHDTTYISTIGDRDTVHAELSKSGVDTDPITIQHAAPDTPLHHVSTTVTDAATTTDMIVVTVVNDVTPGAGTGVSRAAYQNFLNDLQSACQDTGTVAILHRYTDPDDSSSRHSSRYITEKISDINIELEEHVTGESIQNFLHIPKCRGVGAFDERLKVVFDEELRIDSSRSIA